MLCFSRRITARAVKVVMSTHDLGQAKRIGGEIVLLHRGSLLETGPAEEFFPRPRTYAHKKPKNSSPANCWFDAQ
jgi:ABC-type phosphate transport system ATPase subunit